MADFPVTVPRSLQPATSAAFATRTLSPSGVSGTHWQAASPATAHTTIQPLMLDVGGIWLTQVALILFGHIVSVYLAHVEALRIFASPRRAVVSQLPMLALMTMFTNLGLWILSLPIAGG